MTPFPWDAAMRFGFGVLRLSPQSFWSMTPRELAHAIRGIKPGASVSISRGAMDELMKTFPDTRG